MKYKLSLVCSALLLATAFTLVTRTNQRIKKYTQVETVWLDAEGNETTERPEADEYASLELPEVTYVSEAANELHTAQTHSTSVVTSSFTPSDIQLATATDDEAWQMISQGAFTSYPRGNYSQFLPTLQQLRSNYATTIHVPVWYWENPNDDTNFNKVTRQYTCTVNTAVADLFKHVFEDIYNNPAKPIINLGDSGMGTWVIRKKTSGSTLSAHALGVAIDINPSTGSFSVGGKVYGNGYRNATMSQVMWAQLPESHKKYHVLYDGSPIVETFKAYGFCWGGDWKSGTDCMHFSYLGDGVNARQVGRANYENRGRS